MNKKSPFAKVNTGNQKAAEQEEAVKAAASIATEEEATIPPMVDEEAEAKAAVEQAGSQQEDNQDKDQNKDLSDNDEKNEDDEVEMTPEEKAKLEAEKAAAKAKREANAAATNQSVQQIKAAAVQNVKISQMRLQLQELARKHGRIVGYVANTDARLDIASTSKRDENENKVTLSHKAVHRKPSGRIATIFRMPAILNDMLRLEEDQLRLVTAEELEEETIVTIPESNLQAFLNTVFGGTAQESKEIVMDYVNSGSSKTAASVLSASLGDEISIKVREYKLSDKQREKLIKEGKAPQTRGVSMRVVPKNRKGEFNPINYIPNRKYDTLALAALTAEQIKGLNLAYFSLAAKRTQNFDVQTSAKEPENTPDYVYSGSTGIIVTSTGELSTTVFAQGAVTGFFAEVGHWYKKDPSTGKAIPLDIADKYIVNKMGEIDKATRKLKTTISSKKFGEWDFNVNNYPQIAGLTTINDVQYLSAELIKGAIDKETQARRETSSGNKKLTSSDLNNQAVITALLNAKNSDQASFAGAAIMI